MTEYPSLVRRFPDFLRWAENGEMLADDLSNYHLQMLTGRLGRTVARLRHIDPAAVGELSSRLENLPAAGFHRILFAPQTWLHLSYSNANALPATLAYLRSALDFEEGRRSGWSCLGDLYLPPKGAGDQPPSVGTSFLPQRLWRPPLLPGGAPIDYASDFARGRLPEVPGDSVDFETNELDAILDRIERAFVGMRSVPVADRHFARFVRALVLRKDPAAPGRFASASSQLAIGLVVLRNPQLEIATPDEIADCLIHEMIHILSDIIELQQPFICERHIEALRILSPWTNRSLDLNTYIQACYVWYGLWEFWLAAFGTGGFDDRDVMKCLQRASLGFGRSITEPLEALDDDALCPGLLEGLAVAQFSVQSTARQLGLL